MAEEKKKTKENERIENEKVNKSADEVIELKKQIDSQKIELAETKSSSRI